MRRPATAAALTASTLVGGSVFAASRRLRRLRETPDPDPLPPLRRPDGEHRTVVTDDGTELSTWTTGENGPGPTIVLGHGWTSDLRTWQLVHDPLVVAGYRVVVWDQRGHGRSTVGDAGFGVDLLGSDLAAVLDQLDLHDVIVAGHSMGGIGVQSFALDHPDVVADRVRGLVLVATLGRSVPGVPFSAFKALVGSERYQRLRAEPSSLAMLAHLRAFGPGIRPSVVERNREVFLDCPTSTVIGALEPLVDFDLTDRLPTVTVPALVVTGDADHVTPTSRSSELDDLLPDSRLHRFAGVGHMIPLERPIELAGLIERFVGELDGLLVGP
ncbi:MAG: alpha/beta hydrolase [Actinomycetota bacterium]